MITTFPGKILAIAAILCLILPVGAVTLAQIQKTVVYPLNITYVNGGVGPQGPQGIPGNPGPNGTPGAPGQNGSATVSINNTFTTTGSTANVVNIGTSSAAILNFYIPGGGSVNLSTLYPVYSTIMTVTNQNPATTIGIGNWTLVGG